MPSDLHHHLNGGQTVEELIEALQEFDPKAKVVFTYNYGDHGRTMVAEAIGSVELAKVTWSPYCRLPRLVEDHEIEEESDDEDNDDPNVIEVVVLG